MGRPLPATFRDMSTVNMKHGVVAPLKLNFYWKYVDNLYVSFKHHAEYIQASCWRYSFLKSQPLSKHEAYHWN